MNPNVYSNELTQLDWENTTEQL